MLIETNEYLQAHKDDNNIPASSVAPSVSENEEQENQGGIGTDKYFYN